MFSLELLQGLRAEAAVTEGVEGSVGGCSFLRAEAGVPGPRLQPAQHPAPAPEMDVQRGKGPAVSLTDLLEAKKAPLATSRIFQLGLKGGSSVWKIWVADTVSEKCFGRSVLRDGTVSMATQLSLRLPCSSLS